MILPEKYFFLPEEKRIFTWGNYLGFSQVNFSGYLYQVNIFTLQNSYLRILPERFTWAFLR